MNEQYQQALTAMPVEDVAFILSQLPSKNTAAVGAPKDVAPQQFEVADTAGDGTTDSDDDSRRRRHIEREWPEIGTELWADYYGVYYTADVFPANKRLKSGKQIRITSGPALGTVCDSFSEAMIAATEKQRADQGLARKGVSNGKVVLELAGQAGGERGGYGGGVTAMPGMHFFSTVMKGVECLIKTDISGPDLMKQ